MYLEKIISAVTILFRLGAYEWNKCTNLDHAGRLKGCKNEHEGKTHHKDVPHSQIDCHFDWNANQSFLTLP